MFNGIGKQSRHITVMLFSGKKFEGWETIKDKNITEDIVKQFNKLVNFRTQFLYARLQPAGQISNVVFRKQNE